VIAGVCGGLGEFFGISAFWFRLLFVILLLPGGLPGLVPYLVLWVIVPKESRS
jgi:phage shock protein C